MGAGTDLMKKFVEIMNEKEDLQKMMKNWTKIAAYELEGEDPFYIEHKADGTCEFHAGKPEKANFTLIGTAELWSQIVKGEKDAQKAFFAKEYKITGDVMATMKLLPVIKKLKDFM